MRRSKLYSVILVSPLRFIVRENHGKYQVNLTFPEVIAKVKSLNTCTSGRDGYLKLTWLKSMLPLTLSSFMPSTLVESILDLLSMKASMDIVDS